jgi:hypothetical protein
VRIPPGWACFFRTDLVHAGAGDHATTHARFHFYADVRGAQPGDPLFREFDVTGLVPGYRAEGYYVLPPPADTIVGERQRNGVANVSDHGSGRSER